MIGISFLLFMCLDRSVTSYLVIDTLMLGAFGICDLFWRSILGSFLDHTINPAQVLGLGLSMNVLGVLLGGIAGNFVMEISSNDATISVISLLVIFATIIFLPLLNTRLTGHLKEHVFLVKLEELSSDEKAQTLSEFKVQKQLTNKEAEVVQLLLRGYTYKVIAGALFISENTLKYHIKNIYQKLNINNKMDLIKMFQTEI